MRLYGKMSFPEVFNPSVIPVKTGIQLDSRLHGNDEKRGFDVVIGNPPYLGGREWKNKEMEKYFISKYQVAE